MLADSAAHFYGLQLIKATALPGGTLYPIMARLEGAGWVTGDWEESVAHIAEGRPPRHYYRFTDDGAGRARDALAGASSPVSGAGWISVCPGRISPGCPDEPARRRGATGARCRARVLHRDDGTRRPAELVRAVRDSR